MTMTKSKIMKQCRIRLMGGTTVYCSRFILDQVRSNLVALEKNVWCPIKNRGWDVTDKVFALAREHPEHFSESFLCVVRQLGGGVHDLIRYSR